MKSKIMVAAVVVISMIVFYLVSMNQPLNECIEGENGCISMPDSTHRKGIDSEKLLVETK